VVKEDISRAEKILGHVLEHFADAEGVSAKFKTRASGGKSSLAVYDLSTELDTVSASLHQKMRELSVRRQNQTLLRQKVKWALYEEKHFRKVD
jgi:Prion-inhibition and propagation